MSDLIDKDTRAQGRRMALDWGKEHHRLSYLGLIGSYHSVKGEIPVSTTVSSVRGLKSEKC